MKTEKIKVKCKSCGKEYDRSNAFEKLFGTNMNTTEKCDDCYSKERKKKPHWV